MATRTKKMINCAGVDSKILKLKRCSIAIDIFRMQLSMVFMREGGGPLFGEMNS